MRQHSLLQTSVPYHASSKQGVGQRPCQHLHSVPLCIHQVGATCFSSTPVRAKVVTQSHFVNC